MKISIILIAGLFLSGCSHRLAGTWTIQKYETIESGSQSQTMSLTNIGTLTFNKNGTGEKNINYTIMGMTLQDTIPFEWVTNKRFMTLVSENSEFDKVWIIMEDTKDYQKWKSTDGIDQVQILELIK